MMGVFRVIMGILWVFLMNEGKERRSVDERRMMELKGGMLEYLVWLREKGDGVE